MPEDPGKVVICGGGIIGVATAYHLTLKGAKDVTIVECNEVASAASGKAGGFLAMDWNDQTPFGPLARLGYEMHKTLPEELKEYGTVDYRSLGAISAEANDQEKPKSSLRRSSAGVPEWLDGNVLVARELSQGGQAAQVHPRKLTKAMLKAAESRGAKLKIGTVERIVKSESEKKVEGVMVDGALMPADVVLIAMGPWSNAVTESLDIMELSTRRYHSITMDADVPASAVFLQYHTPDHDSLDPEIYPRPNGEVYMCGLADGVPVPDDPAAVVAEQEKLDQLKMIASKLSSRLEAASVTSGVCCYIPVAPDGAPMMGAIPGLEGGYIATAHNCWGILEGPSTGLVMSELIMEGEATSVDISHLSVARFDDEEST